MPDRSDGRERLPPGAEIQFVDGSWVRIDSVPPGHSVQLAHDGKWHRIEQVIARMVDQLDAKEAKEAKHALRHNLLTRASRSMTAGQQPQSTPRRERSGPTVEQLIRDFDEYVANHAVVRDGTRRSGKPPSKSHVYEQLALTHEGEQGYGLTTIRNLLDPILKARKNSQS